MVIGQSISPSPNPVYQTQLVDSTAGSLTVCDNSWLSPIRSGPLPVWQTRLYWTGSKLVNNCGWNGKVVWGMNRPKSNVMTSVRDCIRTRVENPGFLIEGRVWIELKRIWWRKRKQLFKLSLYKVFYNLSNIYRCVVTLYFCMWQLFTDLSKY